MAFAAGLTACAPIQPQVSAAPVSTCTSSVYWEGFGLPLADGKRHSPDEMIAAHRTLPFGTRVRVTAGSRSITVTIADRGPFVRGRCIDLSRGAARALAVSDLSHVTIELIP